MHLILDTSRSNKKSPLCGGFLKKRMMGLEPTTFCMASRRSSQLSYIRERGQYSPALRRIESLVHEPIGQLVVLASHGVVAHGSYLARESARFE
jgi:hypothetical protein